MKSDSNNRTVLLLFIGFMGLTSFVLFPEFFSELPVILKCVIISALLYLCWPLIADSLGSDTIRESLSHAFQFKNNTNITKKLHPHKNVCLGFLFINGTLSEHYLAFSDNKADDDEDFIQWGRQDNHFYCTYNFEQLRKLSPLDILNPDLKIVSPLKLEERQKKYQTCAERKIITCVHERHKSELSNSEINETKRELSLVLLTKLTPCEFCQLLIAKQQKLQIKVLSCNYLWLILDCVKEIPNNTENYESTFDNIKGILEFIGYNLQSENSNSQSVKQTGTQQVTNVKTPNKDNKDNENRQLYPYAQRLCNNLRKEGEGPYTMKTVLKSLTTKDNHALPEKAIEQLIGANSSEEK